MTKTPLKTSDPELYNILLNEVVREDTTLELIASENFVSYPVLEMAGGVMTNKYAEGYPGNRYYGGCEFVDQAENIAKDRANKLFGVEYSNVQPHSGSQANMAVFHTFVDHGDTIMGLDLSHGGHLTHGSKVNFSGKSYNFISYQVSRETGRVNFDQINTLAKEHKPKLIICGGSAYPRFIEFEQFAEVAKSYALIGDFNVAYKLLGTIESDRFYKEGIIDVLYLQAKSNKPETTDLSINILNLGGKIIDNKFIGDIATILSISGDIDNSLKIVKKMKFRVDLTQTLINLAKEINPQQEDPLI